ncbi:MAG: hydrogenase maturation nickel metallochaperone HypA [Acidobacteria bacterium]|jgi:Zn finger protein HypA/HybF involved in hydrogenase expression|nr:hydrogenase maturation nickel metallochaperone HypA [Acidobacteriota bacterium]MCU0253896.1 hydrogenase maturation nickel metallochaperone HypA [Acidobacteriota bacterium]
MQAHAPARLSRVTVAVGELSAVEPDLLAFAWQAIVGEGPDGGAELQIDWRRARQYCPACRADKRQGEGSWMRLCLDCGATLRIDGGTELDVIEIELTPAGEENAE